MITATIWLVWAAIGWAFDLMAKQQNPPLFRTLGVAMCWTAAAVCATIVVNR